MSMWELGGKTLTEDPAAPRQAGVGLSARSRRRVLGHIESRLAETITLDELAGVARMSKFHFARSFKASIGMSPLRYIQSRRIEAAKRKLAESDASVADVAHDCGFSSHSHFTTAFKAATGRSPRAFRRGLLILMASLFLDWLRPLAPLAIAAGA